MFLFANSYFILLFKTIVKIIEKKLLYEIFLTDFII